MDLSPTTRKIQADMKEDMENRFPGLEECSLQCIKNPMKILSPKETDCVLACVKENETVEKIIEKPMPI